jgi:WD40 repeat protein
MSRRAWARGAWGALAVALVATVARAEERGVLVRGGEPESILQGTSWALLGENITAVAFSPDGSLLASGGDDHWVRVWEVSTGRELQRMKLIEPVQKLVFNSTGSLLAVSDSAGRTQSWDVRTGRLAHPDYEGYAGAVSTLAFLENDELLAALGDTTPGEKPELIQGSTNTPYQVWNVKTGEPLPLSEAKRKVEALRGQAPRTADTSEPPMQAQAAQGSALQQAATTYSDPVKLESPSKELLALAGNDASVRVVSIRAPGAFQRLLKGHVGPVRSVAFSQDERLLASGGSDNTVRVWDVATGSELRRLQGNLQPVWALAFKPADGSRPFNPEESILASGGSDALVHLWDANTGYEREFLVGHSRPLRSVAFSPDGLLLAAGGDDDAVTLWEPGTRQEPRRLGGHTRPVRSVAFSQVEPLLASGGEDGLIQLWRSEPLAFLHTMEAHTGPVWAVAFSPVEPLLASGGGGKSAENAKVPGETREEDGQLFLWEPATGKPTALKLPAREGRLPTVRSVAFSPNGQWLASGDDGGRVRLWDVRTQSLKRTLPPHEASVYSVAFSPDGSILAAGSGKRVRLWSVATGQPLGELTGHERSVLAVAFSPDGRSLASGSEDGAVRLWSLGGDRPLRAILRGARQGWMSHLPGQRVYRQDDGRFLTRAGEGSLLSEVPPQSDPPAQPGTPLQLSLSLAEGEEAAVVSPGDFGEPAGQLILQVSNAQGADRAYWIRVEPVDPPPGLRLLPPSPIARLEAGGSQKIRVGLSYVRPQGAPRPGTAQLRLKLVDALKRESPELAVPLELKSPELELEGAPQLEGKAITLTLKNTGTQDTGPVTVTAVFLDEDDKPLGSRDTEVKNLAAQGGTGELTFRLPADSHRANKLFLRPTVQFTKWPRTWEGPRTPLREVDSWTWLFVAVAMLGVGVVAFLYHDRVYRNPMVVQAAKAPSVLKTYSLPHLPAADQALRRVRKRDSTLTAAGIPLTRWERALRGSRQPNEAAAAFAEAIGARLGQSLATDAWALALPPLRLRFARDTAVVVIDGTRLESGEAERRMADVFQDGRGPSQVLVLDRTQTQNAREVLQDVPRVRSVVVGADRLRDLLLAEEPVRLLETTISEQVAVSELSPYQVAGGVKLDNLFFGREREVRAIADRAMRNFLVVGQRQMGKSSLLLAVLRRLQSRTDVEAQYVELADADLHRRLAREREKLPAPGAPLPPLADIAAGVPSKPRVWLIDEADDFIAADAKAGYPVLQELRALAEEGRAYFVLAGFWELYRAVVLDEKQPLRNFGEHLRLEPLDARAATDLITEPMKALGLHWDAPTTPEYLLEQTGRRANLLVLACKALVESLPPETHTLTREHVERMLREDKDLRDQGRRWRGDHPLHRAVVRQALLLGRPTRDEVRQALKARGADIRSTDFDEAMDHRELSYVLVPDSEGRLYCPVPLMQRYIESERALESGLTEDLEDLRRRGLSGVPPPV